VQVCLFKRQEICRTGDLEALVSRPTPIVSMVSLVPSLGEVSLVLSEEGQPAAAGEAQDQ
jgi:hypothetical protein